MTQQVDGPFRSAWSAWASAVRAIDSRFGVFGWVWLASNLSLIVALFFTGNVGVWGLAVITWLNGFFYAIKRIQRRAFLAAFLVCIFLFLMTYDFMERVLGYAKPSVSEAAHPVVSAMILLAVGALVLVYGAADFVRERGGLHRHHPVGAPAEPTWLGLDRATIRRGALVAFYGTLPLAVASLVQKIGVTRKSSYAGMFTEHYLATQDGVLGTVATYGAEVFSLSFLVYLATLPSLGSAAVPLSIRMVYAGAHLLAGRRMEIAVLLLFLLCYAILRTRLTPRDPWLTRKVLIAGLIFVPVVLTIFAGLEAWRGVGKVAGGFSLTAIPDFLHGQGVTIKVLENMVIHRDLLPDQHYLLEFTHRGFIPRIFGLEVFEGNSVNRALRGDSLSHSLSYLVLGERYLEGIATGSSFIAEGFVDFGWAGIALVAAIFSLILHWMDQFGRDNIPSDIFRLVIGPSILWAPRGSATGFVSDVIGPSTILTLVGVLAIALVVFRPRTAARTGGARSVEPGQ